MREDVRFAIDCAILHRAHKAKCLSGWDEPPRGGGIERLVDATPGPGKHVVALVVDNIQAPDRGIVQPIANREPRLPAIGRLEDAT